MYPVLSFKEQYNWDILCLLINFEKKHINHIKDVQTDHLTMRDSIHIITHGHGPPRIHHINNKMRNIKVKLSLKQETPIPGDPY